MTTDSQLDDLQYEDPNIGYEGDEEAYDAYRTMSKAAVLALVFSLLGLLGLVFPALLFFALLAVLLGLLALRNIRRYPNELTGRASGILGLALGAILLVGGISMHSFIYATEVPPGYTRISFNDLDFDSNAPLGKGNALPIELNDLRAFVKGYVHPGVADIGEIRKFVLVPDMGTCCFGGQPDLSDMIEVTILGDHGIRYTRRKRKLAGTFHVTYRHKRVAGGLNGGYYELDADYVK